MADLSYFTLTATLTAVITDYVDVGTEPDQQPISCTIEFRPRIPAGKLLWLPTLTPPRGVALAPIRGRCDTDGVLRTIQEAPVNEQQIVTVAANPGGAPFTMSFKGSPQSVSIPRNASYSAFESAIEGLSTVGASNANVTGPNGGPWVVTFNDTLGNEDVPQLVPSTTDITVTTTRPGTLAAGVKLTAGTSVLGLGSFDPATQTGGLIYDTVISQAVFNKSLQTLNPFGFVAQPEWAGTTVDLATVQKIPPAAGI